MGLLVAVEVAAAGLGCLVLARRGQDRWTAWWVAVVVAVHLVPLGWLLRSVPVAAVGVVQIAALLLLVPRLRTSTRPTSATVGPVMGGSLLCAALVSGVLALTWTQS